MATEGQISYLCTLLGVSYISQARQRLGLSTSKCNRGLTKAEASQLIEAVKAGRI